MKNSNYISIRQYLENRGINPVKDRGYYGMYRSPFRKDINPSFKVDYEKNLWHDFGTGEGGSIVDLVMKLEDCSLAEAFQRLDDNSFSFQRNNNIAPAIPIVREPAIKIRDILPLTHPALLRFLTEQRCVNTDIAKRYCSEVHYLVADNSYFAVGFRNDVGGWELRNRDFQGTVSPKNITTINNDSDTVMAFEGFFDFLSYLMLKQNPSPTIDTVDGKVFDTTFMSNRSAKIAEEISREMGLTIANDVRKQKQHQEAYADPSRQQAKEKLQQIAYYELFKNDSLAGFLHSLEREGIGIEPAKNKQGKTYGIRFNYEGYTFKASEIGREFGFNSIAKNFSSSPEASQSQQIQQNYNQNTNNQQSYSGVSSGIASLLADLFTPNGHSPEEDDNTLKHKKKKTKKRYYGRQF